MPRSFAARAISLTWSSNLRMLPGLTRTAAQPASIAAKTYFGWKWMSAITGICECCAISGSASASSWLGHATRTMSQPVAVSSAICWSVALTSEVSVVVIDWTEIGESLPTPTVPTLIWRVLRRGARTGAEGRACPGDRRPEVMPSSYGPGSTTPLLGHASRARPGNGARRRIPQRRDRSGGCGTFACGPPTPGAGRSAEVQGYDDVGDDQHHAHRPASRAPRRRPPAAAWRRRRTRGRGGRAAGRRRA